MSNYFHFLKGQNKLERLRRFNFIMGFLHLIQGIAMVFLAIFVIEKIAEFQPQIVQLYITYDGPINGLVVASKDLFVLPFGILVASFLIISALAHALISIPNNLFDVYAKDLEKGINRFRWFEYALSSSIMIVLISTLFGITDIGSLILIFIVNAAMNLFGLVMEQLNEAKSKINWGPFIWGSIAGIAPWIVIIVYMTGNPALDQVPWFVLFGAMQP